METLITIETENDMIVARRITANGFGRLDQTSKGYRLTIFPEFAILEKLFSIVNLW